MSASRLQRLQAMVHKDLEALPDLPRPPPPQPDPPSETAPALDPVSDDEDPIGGVSVAANNLPSGTTPINNFTQDWINEVPAVEENEPTDHLVYRIRQVNIDADQDATPQSALPPSELEYGQRAAFGQVFVPILPFSKLPYKFIWRSDSDRVAKTFFDQGKFWQRQWDLYYLWPPADAFTDKPLILITLAQAQALVWEINSVFKHIDFRFSDYHQDVGLVFKIPDPALSPRYLGRSNSKDEYTRMERGVPPRSYHVRGESKLPPPEERTLETFKQRFEDAVELNKAKSKTARARKKEQRVQIQQNWGRQFKRTQRYLGLRPKRTEPDPLLDGSLSWQELLAAQAARKIPPIDPKKLVPYPFDSSVVFVCVDVEAYERDNSKITEVGIATLDVMDLVGTPPGSDGKNWFDKIRARHLRIDDYKHLNNGDFVAGCADRFEFGTSEFVRLADAPAVVASCFKPPFSARLVPTAFEGVGPVPPSPASPNDLISFNDFPAYHDGATCNEHNAVANVEPSLLTGDGKRHIIFVGHDANQDINFLQKLGYNPLNLSNMLEIIDTAQLHKVWKQDQQSRSLANCLYDLDIAGWNLHNGGNDAVYTMQVMIAIAVREAVNRGTKEAAEQMQALQQKRMSDAIMETIKKVNEDHEGWSSAEGEDGGTPVKANQASDLSHDSPIGRGGSHTGRGGRGRGAGRGRGGNNFAHGSRSAISQQSPGSPALIPYPPQSDEFRSRNQGRKRGRGGSYSGSESGGAVSREQRPPGWWSNP